MCDVARQEFGIMWNDFSPDKKLRIRVEELVLGKYLQEAYNCKR
jgi:hypothetical protein